MFLKCVEKKVQIIPDDKQGNSEDSLATIKYSINHLWLNRQKPENPQDFSCNKVYFQALVEQSKLWREKNLEAEVNIWYDSRITHLEATQATKKHLSDLKIKLLNINDIEVVSANPDVLGPHMPLYYRVDLLKLIICTYEARNKDSAIFVDAKDKRLPPADKNKLFNPSIREQLNKIGFVTNPLENQFIQITNDEQIIKTLKFVINLNLIRGASRLNLPEDHFLAKHAPMTCLYENPYRSTQGDIGEHYAASKFGTITVKNKNGEEQYDVKTHGYSPFGLFYVPGRGFLSLENDEIIFPTVKFNYPKDLSLSTYRDDIPTNGDSHVDNTFVSGTKPANNSDKYSWVPWEEAVAM